MDYVVENARKIFEDIGPGFDDEVYLAAMKIGLQQDEQMIEEDRKFDIKYLDFYTGHSMNADLVVNQEVIVLFDEDRDYLKRLVKISGLKKGVSVSFGPRLVIHEYSQ